MKDTEVHIPVLTPSAEDKTLDIGNEPRVVGGHLSGGTHGDRVVAAAASGRAASKDIRHVGRGQRMP